MAFRGLVLAALSLALVLAALSVRTIALRRCMRLLLHACMRACSAFSDLQTGFV